MARNQNIFEGKEVREEGTILKAGDSISEHQGFLFFLL
jgi:hypothetical protein